MLRRVVPFLAAVSMVFAAYAKPITESDLKKVNDYIKAELEKEEHGEFSVEITKGETEEYKTANGVEELISALSVIFSANDEGVDTGKGYVNLALSQGNGSSEVSTEAGLSWKMDNPKEFFEESSDFALQIIDSVNKKGFYKAELKISPLTGGGYEAELALAPASEEAVSIKSLVLKGVFPDVEQGFVDVDFAALFSLASDLVSNAQKSLTQVFKALQAEREPTEDEMEGLEALFEAVFAELGFAGE